MKSVSVYVYKSEENVIEEIAKDYNPNWMSSVCKALAQQNPFANELNRWMH